MDEANGSSSQAPAKAPQGAYCEVQSLSRQGLGLSALAGKALECGVLSLPRNREGQGVPKTPVGKGIGLVEDQRLPLDAQSWLVLWNLKGQSHMLSKGMMRDLPLAAVVLRKMAVGVHNHKLLFKCVLPSDRTVSLWLSPPGYVVCLHWFNPMQNSQERQAETWAAARYQIRRAIRTGWLA